MHGLPEVTVSVFFPSVYKDDEYWWGTRAPNTVYTWDSLTDQDKQNEMQDLCDTEHWVVWKTKEEIWTHTLKEEGFHQLLSLDKDTEVNN